MTNAIETTKRVMYSWLAQVKMLDQGGAYQLNSATLLENHLEMHLAALHQELTYQTKRAIGAIEERDAILGRLHAIDHAFSEQASIICRQAEEVDRHKIAINIAGDEIRRLQTLIQLHRHDRDTSAQDSTENVASEQPDTNALMIILGALVDSQRIVTDWLVPDGIKAKKAMPKLLAVLDNETLVAAQKVFEQSPDDAMLNECAHDYASSGGCPECGARRGGVREPFILNRLA